MEAKRTRLAVVCGTVYVLLAVRFIVAVEDVNIHEGKKDLLLPYSSAGFYDVNRHHRHVRNCQRVEHGNTTFEVKQSANAALFPDTPEIEVHYFRQTIASGRTISGHIAVATNPSEVFSVLEPQHPGTCSKSRAPRATVSQSARQRSCHVATNAGFFDTSTGACIGNLVSDGKHLQTSAGIQNANFGIRKDGSMVIGYLDEDHVISKVNPFVQLVSGVGWILRRGELYLEESRKAECADSQETGSLERFYSVISARTAVGYDSFGRIVLAHIDGKTADYGASLEEFALYLQSQDVVDAINLDGGGSSTFVINGTVVNYPSDQCGITSFYCEREVSTIVCLHSADATTAVKSVDQQSDMAFTKSVSLLLALSSLLATSVVINLCLAGTFRCRRRRQQLAWPDHWRHEEQLPLAMEEM